MAKKEAEVVETAEVTEGPRMAKKVTGIVKTSKLTVIAESNPKRPGSSSYDRFEGYFATPAPATVEDALQNGLTMGDIKYDIVHGFITVEGAEVEEYEVNPRGPRSGSEAASSEEVVAEETASEEVY